MFETFCKSLSKFSMHCLKVAVRKSFLCLPFAVKCRYNLVRGCTHDCSHDELSLLRALMTLNKFKLEFIITDRVLEFWAWNTLSLFQMTSSLASPYFDRSSPNYFKKSLDWQLLIIADKCEGQRLQIWSWVDRPTAYSTLYWEKARLITPTISLMSKEVPLRFEFVHD